MMKNADICQAKTVQILHCCMKKGVNIRIHLNKPVHLQCLDKTLIDKMYVVDTVEGGFFRFNLCDIVTITGILRGSAVTAMFAYFRKEKALQCLDNLFPGTQKKYESLFVNMI